MSTQQKNIWSLQKFYSQTSISSLCGAIIYHEKRDIGLLRRAIIKTIQTHDALRLRFTDQEGGMQYLSSDSVPIEQRVFLNEAELDEYAHELACSLVSLENCPMCSFTIFHLEDQSGVLVKISHLIADAWSFGLIADEVERLYNRLCFENKYGRNTELPAEFEKTDKESYSYLTYLEEDLRYRQSSRYQKDRSYWQSKYSSRPEETQIKIIEGSSLSIESGRIVKQLPEILSSRIDAFCKQYGMTEAVLFESAILVYLARTCRNETGITIGLPVLNRNRLAEKKTVGMFISTMPLTVVVSQDDTLGELYNKTLSAKREMLRHHRFPYEHILQMLRKHHDFQGHLYDVMVSVQNTEIRGTGSFFTKWYENGYNEVPLTISFDRRDGQIQHTVTMDYQKLVFTKEEAELLFERIKHILLQMTDEHETSHLTIASIDVLAFGERKKQLYTFNDTYVEYPRDKCVHELFAEQVKRTPDREALIFENESFTYKQLDEMSNSLAHYLRSHGIGRNDIVPIIAQRNWRIIVAMLGILKAGGAYMPISPEYPTERIHAMIETTRSKMILCYKDDRSLQITKINLEVFDFFRDSVQLKNNNKSSDLCYVIFTSGSTGDPKGVSICHKNVVNYCQNNQNNKLISQIIQSECRTIVSITNNVFDIFTTESLMPLMNGLIICFANEQEATIQRKLSQLIEKKSVDVIQTTPTKIRTLMLNKGNLKYLSSLKVIVLGGEGFPVDLYKEIRNETGASIFNNYGPTETTVWSTNEEVTGTDNITIGRPIANTQIYILDQNQQMLPIGVAGELCIAGEGVGKGYLNCPELTAERFIENPYATEDNHHGKVLYRTGDLARWRLDGEIEYLGRIDTQVKIRGLRIELGEIESIMSEIDGIGLTAVTALKDVNGKQYLVGYYTEESVVNEKELRNHLLEKLPRYMIPNYFMRIDKMPMTASGKTDRRNLPVPEMRQVKGEYIAPKTEIEKLFCSILEDVLSIERVGTTDDFFEIGGDSLGAITFVSKAQDQGIEICIQDVYEYPTIQSLTRYLQEENAEKDSHRKGWWKALKKEDFEKYSKILSLNCKSNKDIITKRNLGNVLLTGATGFLGAHILHALLRKESGKIYCLIREKDGQTKNQRLLKTLKWYFDDEYKDMLEQRIISVSGDIDHDGLSEELPDDIHTVIHAAAIVKHYGPYSEFEKINVDGTRNVAAFAEKIGAELIQISTASVSGRVIEEADITDNSEGGPCFKETNLYIGQNLDNVYIRSKFEAERLIMDRMLTGRLKAKIIRVGNLTNRQRDYCFQPNYTTNAFLRRMKAILELGKFPDSILDMFTEFSPVDLTADGIINIAQYGGNYTIFHLYNNKPLRNDQMLRLLSNVGINIQAVPEDVFVKAVENTLHEDSLAYIYESLQDVIHHEGLLSFENSIHLENDFSVWFLEKCGFTWNAVDERYLKGYIDYFRKMGYLHV